MKRISLILITLGLFAFSIYLAFSQGSIPLVEKTTESVLIPIQASPLIYTGFKAEVAKVFAIGFNSLMQITGNSVLLGIIILALLVELVLLYPSVRIQIKQKKIHTFHKKLVDRFNSGELSVSEAEDELHKLYDVNEKIHHRGAFLVIIQIIIFFFTFWGLSLMVKVPGLLYGSWNVLNFSLLTKTSGYLLPLLAGLLYFVHAMIKVYFKEKEDYISTSQTTMAVLFAVIGSAVVYLFAGIFAVALILYFVTLVTFSTIRYIIVEQDAEEWKRLAHQELIQMLLKAKPHRNRFEYLSRKWSHLPIVRHINFNLLEEALSMALGLLVALTFFGAFQKSDAYSSQAKIQSPAVAGMVEVNVNNYPY